MDTVSDVLLSQDCVNKLLNVDPQLRTNMKDALECSFLNVERRWDSYVLQMKKRKRKLKIEDTTDTTNANGASTPHTNAMGALGQTASASTAVESPSGWAGHFFGDEIAANVASFRPGTVAEY